jgi:hypothetical protein
MRTKTTDKPASFCAYSCIQPDIKKEFGLFMDMFEKVKTCQRHEAKNLQSLQK